MEDMQPGQVIIPHSSDQPGSVGAPAPEQPTDDELQTTPTPTPAPEPSHQPIAPQPVSEPVVSSTPEVAEAVPEQEAGLFDAQSSPWQYQQDDLPVGQQAPLPDELKWTASEFIAHEKGGKWYGLLVLVGVAAATLDYVFVKDLFSTIVIVCAAAAFGAFAARKPRTQEYTLNHQGVLVGAHGYSFQDFKTFSISEEGAIVSIVFMPLKRFMPPMTIYVAPDMEEQVVDFLAAFLPFEEHKADAIDSLLRRIRF